MIENWKPIQRHPGYEVSDLGRVRSLDRVISTDRGPWRLKGKLLAPGRSSNGYWTVAPCGETHCIHILVLEAFVGPCPEGMLGFHEDDVRSNNVVTNLSWKTPSQNNKNITRLGKRMFTYEEADIIRARLRSGETALSLSAELGCTRRHIYNIKLRAQYVEG